MSRSDRALILYGSRARKDNDEYSDVDVLYAADRAAHGDAEEYAASAGLVGVEPSVYAWDELDSLHADGSLFLVHLARDGLLISAEGHGAQRYTAVVTDLPPYAHIGRDLIGFATALEDVRGELAGDDGCTEFELSVVASVVRHASILGCYLLGHPDFGRYSAVSRFASETELSDLIVLSFPSLYSFRLAQDGRIEFPEIPPSGVFLAWLDNATLVLEKVRGLANQRSAQLLTANRRD